LRSRRTIDLLIDLGLVIIEHQGKYNGRGGRKDPTRYRVTYLKHKHINASGPPSYFHPTNDWIKAERQLMAGTRKPKAPQHKAPHLRKPNIPVINHDRILPGC